MPPATPDHLPYVAFPTTHWSLVVIKNLPTLEAQRRALSHLIQIYLPALRSYLVHGRRIPVDLSEDLLQSFIADRVLEGQLVGNADRARGKFRNYLITALNNFCVSQKRLETARHRQPQSGFVAALSDELGAIDNGVRPGDVFDIEWARQLLSRTLERMRDECIGGARPDVWDVFQERLVTPMLSDTPPTPYAELVGRHGFISPSQAQNVLVTATRMFTRTLRDVIGEYERDPDVIDREIVELREILSRGRARSA